MPEAVTLDAQGCNHPRAQAPPRTGPSRQPGAELRDPLKQGEELSRDRRTAGPGDATLLRHRVSGALRGASALLDRRTAHNRCRHLRHGPVRARTRGDGCPERERGPPRDGQTGADGRPRRRDHGRGGRQEHGVRWRHGDRRRPRRRAGGARPLRTTPRRVGFVEVDGLHMQASPATSPMTASPGSAATRCDWGPRPPARPLVPPDRRPRSNCRPGERPCRLRAAERGGYAPARGGRRRLTPAARVPTFASSSIYSRTGPHDQLGWQFDGHECLAAEVAERLATPCAADF